MQSNRLSKFSNYFLLLTIFLAIFIWSTIQRNAQADLGQNSAKIDFLDVGEGDSALISLPQSKQILIDTGKPGTLLSKLNAKMPAFDREIEAVFLSHPDNDHTGSFVELSSSYKIDKLYFDSDKADSATVKKIQEVVTEKNITKAPLNSGESVYIGGLKIESFWPPGNISSLSDNDSSLILKATIDNSKALFTGDIELKGQEALLNENEDLAADLIKIAHHGSAGAYSENFLKHVGAKNAVISVGPNSYGHPTKTVLDGLINLGINVFRTDQLGTVEFVASENGWIRK